MKYSLILPSYNEAESIVHTLDSLLAEGIPDMEILVVDDHSPDGTNGIVEVYSRDHSSVHAVLHEGERGLSPSVVYGFEKSSGEILICMDADGQHRAEDLRKVLQRFEEADHPCMVIGSRHVSGGGFTEKWNFFRSLFSRTATKAAQISLGIPIRDPMSGFFAVRRKSFDAVKKYMDPHGFKIMLEIAFLLSLIPGTLVVETPIIFAMRQAGRSKLSSRVIFQYLAMLLSCMRKRSALKKELLAGQCTEAD